MRISDWSSDVCSSDLRSRKGRRCGRLGRRSSRHADAPGCSADPRRAPADDLARHRTALPLSSRNPSPYGRRNAVNANRLLMLYSGVLTAVFALAVATSAGADTRPGKAVFDEIDVKRINVREDDGTIRMIVSNTSRAPGIIMHGKERPHPSGNRGAGIIVYKH